MSFYFKTGTRYGRHDTDVSRAESGRPLLGQEYPTLEELYAQNERELPAREVLEAHFARPQVRSWNSILWRDGEYGAPPI